MPLLEKTARSTGGPHTDAAAAFVPDQSRAERPTSFDVAAFPIPTGREEDWRFTPVDRLRSLLTDSPTEDGAVEYAVTAPDGVRIGTLGRGQAPRGTALVPADRAAVVADANSPQATHVKIPPEAELEEPVRVVVPAATRRCSASTSPTRNSTSSTARSSTTTPRTARAT